MRRGVLVVTLLTAACLPSCGESSPTGPNPPRPGITFRPTASPPPPASLSLQARSSTVEEITLVMIATQVEDLYGWAVDLVFDPQILSLISFEQADFLEAEGITVVTELVDGSDGRLIIGQSRVGDVGGVTGDGDLLLLTFRAEAEGSTGIRPEDGAGFDSEGTNLGLQILGGSVTVTR